MKITSTIARYLLGLIFLVFGLNGFLHFIPMPPPTGLAGQYMGALYLSNYLVVIFPAATPSGHSASCQSLRAACADAARPCRGQYLLLSRVHGSQRSAVGPDRCHPLVSHVSLGFG